MAKLVEVYRNDGQKLNKRQLPLFVDENLTVSWKPIFMCLITTDLLRYSVFKTSILPFRTETVESSEGECGRRLACSDSWRIRWKHFDRIFLLFT